MNEIRRDAVLPVADAVTRYGEKAVRHAIATGRWQRPLRGAIVMHSGPLTRDQQRRAALIWAGPRAVLSHATAAELAGLTGFTTTAIHVTVPIGGRARHATHIVVHRSRVLERDVHPVRSPPQTRIERSALDMAAWSATDDAARAVLAAVVQQRLTTAGRLRDLLSQRPTLRRRRSSPPRWMTSRAALIRYRNWSSSPPSGAPAFRSRTGGRCGDGPTGVPSWTRGWAAGLTVEIDGVGHLEPSTWVCDLDRQNGLVVAGERVLRFPSFVVRDQPTRMTDQIRLLLDHLDAE